MDPPTGEWERIARDFLRYLGIKPTPNRIRDMVRIMALITIATSMVGADKDGKAFRAALRVANAQLIITEIMAAPSTKELLDEYRANRVS